MKPAPRLSGMAAALLLLSACQQEKTPGTGKDGGVEANEILPGSASDAMLPYDTVRSQPPLAPRSEGGDSAKPGTRKADAAEASEAEAEPAEAAPAPAKAEEPAPSPAQ